MIPIWLLLLMCATSTFSLITTVVCAAIRRKWRRQDLELREQASKGNDEGESVMHPG